MTTIRPKSKITKAVAAKVDHTRSALGMRRDGLTYAQIAERLGVSHRSARRYVADGLADARRDTAEISQDILDLAVARLDVWLTKLRPQISEGSTSAIMTAIKIEERRAKLLGLDAATRIEAEVSGDVTFKVTFAPEPVIERDQDD